MVFSLFLPACLEEPLVEKAVTDWNENAVYVVGSTVTATCDEGHLAKGDVSSQVVSCQSGGWEAVTGCYAACMAEPPAEGRNIHRGGFRRGVGAIIRYKCVPPHFLRQPGVGGQEQSLCTLRLISILSSHSISI